MEPAAWIVLMCVPIDESEFMDAILVIIGGIIGFASSLAGHWFTARHQREAAKLDHERRLRNYKTVRLRNAYVHLVEAANLYNDQAIDVMYGQFDSPKAERANEEANQAITLLTLEVDAEDTIARLKRITIALRDFKQATDLLAEEGGDSHRQTQMASWDDLKIEVDTLVYDIQGRIDDLEQPV